MNSIGVIGAGAFGTAMACVLAQTGNRVKLWGRNPERMNSIQTLRINQDYLPEVQLPETLTPTSDLVDLAGCKVVLLVVPAQKLRSFVLSNDLSDINCPMVLCAKGIEIETGLLQSQIISELIPNIQTAAISGPGFAGEIASGRPTALTIGCADLVLGERLQSQLSTATMRLYLTQDVNGVQLGGSLKNVLAIACGIVEGQGLGHSARAALMTRGFAEISRLAHAMGAEPETLTGLAGFGDLVLSCSSLQSRNFAFGHTLGKSGEQTTGKTFEGVDTAKACLKLAQRFQADMPIALAVAKILAGDISTDDALTSLMSRPLKQEFRG